MIQSLLRLLHGMFQVSEVVSSADVLWLKLHGTLEAVTGFLLPLFYRYTGICKHTRILSSLIRIGITRFVLYFPRSLHELELQVAEHCP